MRGDQFSSRPRLRTKHLALILFGRASGSTLLSGGEHFVFPAGNQRTARWALRNQAQRDRFRSAQTRGGFAKVNFARCANSFDVPPIGRKVQVRLEDLVFRVMTLELERVEDLSKFPAERARVEMKPQPRQLHRDGRGAGAWMAGTREVPGSPEERHRIHPRMPREILVLKADGRVDQGRRNIVERRPDSIFLIRGERDAEDVAVSIAHPRGEIDFAGQWRLRKRKPNGTECDGQNRNTEQPSILPRSGGFPTAE